MKLIVDGPQRFAKMRAHTATHLLHGELSKIFPNTKQAGSLVDSDFLRFDFYADKMLSDQEIENIENNINNYIYQSLQVSCDEMSLDEAKNKGAKAFFEEKYGDKVRVVFIASHPESFEGYKLDSSGHLEGQIVSIELCGGTHVQNTKDIGTFFILGQEAVASGIKRISAYTGPKVFQRYLELKKILKEVEKKIGVKAENQILDKLEKELKEKEALLSKFESINTKIIIESLKNGNFSSNEVFDKIINVSKDNNLKGLSFKDIIYQSKGIFSDLDVIVYNDDGGFAIITSKQDSSAKIIAKDFGLKGGGSDTIVQGKDPKILDLFH